MKKKKLMVSAAAIALALSFSTTSMAATWENVDSYEKLAEAFGDTDAEVHITLSGNISQTEQEKLIAKEGQKYIIDGKEYTLTDVKLGGSGSVTINAEIKNSDEGETGALQTSDKVSVTVNGNINAAADGVEANDQSTVIVNGDITSKNNDGIEVNDEANVTVNGDIYGGIGADGIDATDDTKVTVNGDVYGGDGQAPDEDGNLSYGNINEPGGYSDAGYGIEANENAEVTVNGNVFGGDSYGTYSYAGSGVNAEDNSKVTVTGNAKGGTQIANPEVSSEAIDGEGNPYNAEGYAGDGVFAHNTANVTVKGDAIGGDAQGKDSYGGAGVYIILTLKVEGADDPTTIENEQQKIKAGQITVGGSVIGGKASTEAAIDSEAVYYAYGGDDLTARKLPDDLIEQISTNDNEEYVRRSIYESTMYMAYELGTEFFDHEERLSHQEEYVARVTELAKEYGVDVDNMEDIEAIVNAIPTEKLQEFAEKALYIYNDLVDELNLECYAIPVLTVGGLEVAGDAELVGAHIDELVTYVLENDYIVINSEEKSQDTTGDGQNKIPTSPKTGDTNRTTQISVVFAMSVLVVLFLVIRMKRERNA